MTKTFSQYLNEIHKKIWDKSEDGVLSKNEIMKTVKTVAGYTVKDRYWEQLQEFEKIEKMPSSDKWVVKKPSDAGLNQENTGEKKRKRVLIPEDVYKAGKQYGVDFSTVLTEAVIEEVSNIKQFSEDYLGEEFTEEESEYIFELIKKDLHKRKGDKQKMSKRGKRRREMFKDVFDADHSDAEKIEELRKKSFQLADILDL